jgi:hypothetical protein
MYMSSDGQKWSFGTKTSIEGGVCAGQLGRGRQQAKTGFKSPRSGKNIGLIPRCEALKQVPEGQKHCLREMMMEMGT